jgi:hypothetical protein
VDGSGMAVMAHVFVLLAGRLLILRSLLQRCFFVTKDKL